MTKPMMPEEARAELELIAHPDDPMRFFHIGVRALETLANMCVEESGRIVDPDTNGGAHQVKTTYRLVGEWTDRNE